QHIGLSKINLHLSQGIYGLLGPNGSGKTTLLKILCRELFPSEGEICINGTPLKKYSSLEREFFFLPDSEGVYSSLTGREFLEIMGRLRGIPQKEIDQKIDEILEYMELAEVGNRKTGTYSRGMKQRLKFGLALMLDYQVYLLDEPLQGTDPLGRGLLLKWIRNLGKKGEKIILVSSHILHEIEMVADYVVAMMDGKIVGQGKMGEIRSLLTSVPRKLRVKLQEPKALASLLVSHFELTHLTVGERVLEVESFEIEPILKSLPSLALDHALHLESFECADERLEEIFALLTRKRSFQKK
ncbi:MAG: ABC transporter ATP-binding protein, partial [Planctomycetota bacterium]